jgi:hypothetical protein
MIELESMAVKMPEVKGHPNRAGFRGVLTVVDAASQRAPAGSKGHRVVLTRAAAEVALPSLLGMALDYAPSLDRHDQRRKVGVITSAEIVGKKLEVGGYLYAKDFPEIVEEIRKNGLRRYDLKAQPSRVENRSSITTKSPLLAKAAGSRAPQERRSLAAAVRGLRNMIKTRPKGSTSICARSAEAGSQGGLGMSYEVTDVSVADTRSHVWVLTHVTFTGAAILRRNRAAYEETWIGMVS